MQCELPNSRLYQFTGNLIADPAAGLTLPINPNAVLLRCGNMVGKGLGAIRRSIALFTNSPSSVTPGDAACATRTECMEQ